MVCQLDDSPRTDLSDGSLGMAVGTSAAVMPPTAEHSTAPGSRKTSDEADEDGEPVKPKKAGKWKTQLSGMGKKFRDAAMQYVLTVWRSVRCLTTDH